MRYLLAPAVLTALALAACRPEAPAPVPLPAALAGAPTEPSPGIVTLAAQIAAGEEQAVTGAVVLTEEAGRLIVAAALDGLQPGGYLIHVHSGADCGESGAPPDDDRLGRFDVGASGQAKFSIERDGAGSPAGFVARAVAIHAREDDGTPGALVGCGVLHPIAR